MGGIGKLLTIGVPGMGGSDNKQATSPTAQPSPVEAYQSISPYLSPETRAQYEAAFQAGYVAQQAQAQAIKEEAAKKDSAAAAAKPNDGSAEWDQSWARPMLTPPRLPTRTRLRPIRTMPTATRRTPRWRQTTRTSTTAARPSTRPAP